MADYNEILKSDRDMLTALIKGGEQPFFAAEKVFQASCGDIVAELREDNGAIEDFNALAKLEGEALEAAQRQMKSNSDMLNEFYDYRNLLYSFAASLTGKKEAEAKAESAEVKSESPAEQKKELGLDEAQQFMTDEQFENFKNAEREQVEVNWLNQMLLDSEQNRRFLELYAYAIELDIKAGKEDALKEDIETYDQHLLCREQLLHNLCYMLYGEQDPEKSLVTYAQHKALMDQLGVTEKFGDTIYTNYLLSRAACLEGGIDNAGQIMYNELNDRTSKAIIHRFERVLEQSGFKAKHPRVSAKQIFARKSDIYSVGTSNGLISFNRSNKALLKLNDSIIVLKSNLPEVRFNNIKHPKQEGEVMENIEEKEVLDTAAENAAEEVPAVEAQEPATEAAPAVEAEPVEDVQEPAEESAAAEEIAVAQVPAEDIEDVEEVADEPATEEVTEEVPAEEPVVEVVTEEVPAEEPETEEVVNEEVPAEEDAAEDEAEIEVEVEDAQDENAENVDALDLMEESARAGEEEPEVEFVIPEGYRLDRSFVAKLLQSDTITKEAYSALKNYLVSYNGVKSRISWKKEAFYKGRVTLATVKFGGKKLNLYVPINAEDLDAKYNAKPAQVGGQTLSRIKITGSKRSVKFANEVVAQLMATQGIERNEEREDVDYVVPFRSTQSLIDEGRAKLVPAVKINGKEQEAEEPVVEPAQEPVVEPVVEPEVEVVTQPQAEVKEETVTASSFFEQPQERPEDISTWKFTDKEMEYLKAAGCTSFGQIVDFANANGGYDALKIALSYIIAEDEKHNAPSAPVDEK